MSCERASPRGAAGALRRSRGGARTDCERCRRRFEDGAFPTRSTLDRVDDGGLICPGCQTYEDRVMDDFRTEIALLELDLAGRNPISIAGFLATWAASLA